MIEADTAVARRMEWMKEFEEKKSVPSICQKFSISRKTFYKWLKRYKISSNSVSSLGDRSRRPHHSPRATSAGDRSTAARASGEDRLRTKTAEALSFHMVRY